MKVRLRGRSLYATILGVAAGFNIGLALHHPIRWINLGGGVLVFATAIPWCLERRQQVAMHLAPHYEIPDFEPPIAIYQNPQGAWDLYQPLYALGHTTPVVQAVPHPAEATGDFSESVRCLERKIVMKPGSGETKQLWWHCYGGITTDQCEWGEGHWCMVTFGESSKDPEEMNETIDPNHNWTTPMMYLKSFDHDPTEEEKQKITPLDYRDPVKVKR
jgi:hypothetical protein